jgi:hypothetical protein
MKRLSVGTISALCLASAVSPAVLANTIESQAPTTNQAATQLLSQGQQVPGQQIPGQQVPGQQVPGQQVPGQQIPGQQMPGQQMPGQQVPGQQMPGQPSQTLHRGATLSPDIVSPFQLVYMALGGELQEYGIRGGQALIQNTRTGNVNGQDIVETAARQGYISNDILTDQLYIDRVNRFLSMKQRDWRS